MHLVAFEGGRALHAKMLLTAALPSKFPDQMPNTNLPPCSAVHTYVASYQSTKKSLAPDKVVWLEAQEPVYCVLLFPPADVDILPFLAFLSYISSP